MTISAWFTRASTLGTALVLLVLAGAGPPAAAQVRGLELAPVLDAYSQGRFDDALAPVQRATRAGARAFRQELVLRGTQWVDAVPADRSRRALAAAAFALEVERIRAERGEWPVDDEKDCAGECVIEWACTLLQSRGAADESERLWMLASIALAGGVRAWSFLQMPLGGLSQRTVQSGHVHHALARFPGDSRLRLARAVAFASRNAVTGERDTPRDGAPARVTSGVVVGPAFLNELMDSRRTRLSDFVKQELEALSGDDVVGSEARVRLGYLHWVTGDERAALEAQRAAADAATDPDLRYVANFLAAQAAQALGDLPAAETRYRAALGARPNSQSATLGLATLLYLRGEAKEAYDLVEASRTNLPRDDDPWRLFLYGDFLKLPALVTELRRQVSQ